MRFDRIIKDIVTAKENVEKEIVSGSYIDNFSKYRFLQGQVIGIETALNVIRDILGEELDD